MLSWDRLSPPSPRVHIMARAALIAAPILKEPAKAPLSPSQLAEYKRFSPPSCWSPGAPWDLVFELEKHNMVDFFGFVSCFLLLSLFFIYVSISYIYIFIYLFINLLTYCSQIMDSTVNFFNLFMGVKWHWTLIVTSHADPWKIGAHSRWGSMRIIGHCLVTRYSYLYEGLYMVVIEIE